MPLPKASKGATKECLETILQKLARNHNATGVWIASELFADQDRLKRRKKAYGLLVGNSDTANDDDEATLAHSPATTDPSKTALTPIIVGSVKFSTKRGAPMPSTTLHSNRRNQTGLKKKSNKELAEGAWAQYKMQKTMRRQWKAWDHRVSKVVKRSSIAR